MKKILKSFGLCTLIFAIVIFVIVFIFSALAKNNIIDAELSDMILGFIGIPLLFFYAFFFGKTIKKRGILDGIFLVLIYLAISLTIMNINKSFEPLKITLVIIKSFSLLLGSIIGVNFATKSENRKLA